MRVSLTIVPFLSVVALAPFAAPQTLQHAIVAGTLANSSGASTQVESMGDVNGDGLEDFLVWGLAQHFPWEQEEARVHSGSDGALLHRTTLGNAVEFPEYSLGVLGDLDSDGVLDYARGGTRMVGNQWEGFVRIFSGMTGTILLEIPYSANLFPAGDGAGFGGGIGSVGDLTGDGIPDIAIGAPAERAHIFDSGGLYIFSGATGDFQFHMAAPGGSSGFGSSIEPLDDISGDGVEDFLVGAITENNVGAIYAVSGSNGAVLYRIPGQPNDQHLGRQMESLQDLDSDGVLDFVVGTRDSVAGFPSAARIKAYSGATGSLLYDRHYGGQGALQLADISPTMDSNQDGVRDLLIAAYSDRERFPGLGMVLHVSGADGSILSLQEGDLLEMGVLSVASLGDLSGNGHGDWAVGHFSTIGLDHPGGVQIMHGGCRVQEAASCVVPPNSTGMAASLQAVACGDASSQGEMQIRMLDLPPYEFGYVMMSGQTGSTPVAGSTLCLGGGITRLNSPTTGIFRSDESGYASRIVNWGAFPEGAMVLPGSTWHFQVVHRDRGLAVPFHLTHALAIPF